MAATQTKQKASDVSTGELLKELLDRPMTERQRAVNDALLSREQQVEDMLPDFMKGQAKRLIKRAMMTLQRNPDLNNVPPADFVRMVLEAAELGFAIDGRMCYVVKYKSAYQMQLDYKAVIAVARRSRTIAEIETDVVHANDTFDFRRVNGTTEFRHEIDISAGERGDVIAAYARVFLPNGQWSVTMMTRAELDAIQRRAPAQNGPWKTDPDEMRKKTVARRALKHYQDDPGVMRMMELTQYDDEPADEVKRETLADLRERLLTKPIGGDKSDDTPPTLPEIDEAVKAYWSAELAKMTTASDIDAAEADWSERAADDNERTVLRSMCEQRRGEL